MSITAIPTPEALSFGNVTNIISIFSLETILDLIAYISPYIYIDYDKTFSRANAKHGRA